MIQLLLHKEGETEAPYAERGTSDNDHFDSASFWMYIPVSHHGEGNCDHCNNLSGRLLLIPWEKSQTLHCSWKAEKNLFLFLTLLPISLVDTDKHFSGFWIRLNLHHECDICKDGRQWLFCDTCWINSWLK